jgi:SHS2 domain-containing protein
MTGEGYRAVPHTADLRVEAWAETCCDCIAAALRGLISTFADVGGARPVRVVQRQVEAGSPADLLAAAADEIIYILDTDGEIPLSVQVRPGHPTRSSIVLRLELASAGSAEFTGAIPKAVSLHELACEADAVGSWSASMTVDV